MAIDEHRPFGCQRFFQHRFYLFRAADGQGLHAEGFCQQLIVGLFLQCGLGETSAVKQLLPLTDHAQYLIVENQLNYRDSVFGQGGKLVAVHVEAAVSGDIHHLLFRQSYLCAQSSAETKAHGSQSAGGNKLPGAAEPVELGGPHLMLADFRCQNGLAVGQAVQSFQHLLRRDGAFLPGKLNQRVFCLPAGNIRHPVFMFLLGKAVQKLLHNGFCVALQLHVHFNVLVEFRRVNVDLNHRAMTGKQVGVAGHPVGKTGSHRHKQVTIL